MTPAQRQTARRWLRKTGSPTRTLAHLQTLGWTELPSKAWLTTEAEQQGIPICKPGRKPGQPAKPIAKWSPVRVAIQELIATEPDLTTEQIRVRLAGQGMNKTPGLVRKYLAELRMTPTVK
jgi:hypothetical protein